MKRSAELEAVVRKLVSTSDTVDFRDLLFESPDLVTIGTDEREWHHGWDEVANPSLGGGRGSYARGEWPFMASA